MEAKKPVAPVCVPAHGFRYLLDPEAVSVGQTAPQPCIVCGEARPGFHLVLDDDDAWDAHYVCEPCLRAGRLADRGLRINEGDREALEAQLAVLRADLSLSEREALAQAGTREVDCATPRPAILQPFTWPAHGGDYYGFFKPVNREELVALAPDGDGQAFFARHVRCEEWTDEEWIANVWKEGFTREGFLTVYLWRCLHCGDTLITWTHD